MWMVDPQIMCRQHLLGEHNEIHKLVGSAVKGRSIEGYLHGLCDPSQFQPRHKELVLEMQARGYHHNSPLPIVEKPLKGRVDKEVSLQELIRRCKECRAREVLNEHYRSNYHL